MILKIYELNKIDIEKNNLFLFYGKNEGLKKEKINEIVFKKKESKLFRYEEKEILENKDNFYEGLTNKSLFESNKIILVERSTDKLLSIIDSLTEKLGDTLIILKFPV